MRRQAATETMPLLTPAEVAAAFRVDPKTVTRWAKSGKLNSIRTLGGHRRFLATEVHAMLLETPASERPTPFRVCLIPVCLPTSDRIRPVALASAAAVPTTSSSEPSTV